MAFSQLTLFRCLLYFLRVPHTRNKNMFTWSFPGNWKRQLRSHPKGSNVFCLERLSTDGNVFQKITSYFTEIAPFITTDNSCNAYCSYFRASSCPLFCTVASQNCSSLRRVSSVLKKDGDMKLLMWMRVHMKHYW